MYLLVSPETISSEAADVCQDVLEEHRSVTTDLRIVARLECGGDFAGLPAESATTDRAALAVCTRR